MLDTTLSPDALDRLADSRGFIFDMDGTLVLGNKMNTGIDALPGAIELLEHLKTKGIPFAALTNGSAKTPREYGEALRNAGLPLEDRQILTPPAIAAQYFVAKKLQRVLVLGCEGVWRPLDEVGLDISISPELKGEADAVFSGWYREFSVRDLETACQAIWDGAKLFTVSNVPFFATAQGRAIGTSSAINAMIANATKKRAKVLGKPSREALRCASQILGVKPAEIAVVGDDPLLEMRMAKAGGALGVGVTTGLADAADFAGQKGDRRPDLIFANVGELMKKFKAIERR